LIGERLTVDISSNYFFSVENKLKILYDEIRLSRLSEDKVEKMYEEFDKVILMLG